MGRYCARLRCTGWAAGSPRPAALLLLHWAGLEKRFGKKNRRTRGIDPCFFSLLLHVLEQAWTDRGRPGSAPGGRPAAGTAPGRCTAARGGAREPGNHGVRRHGRRRRRPRRELGWSLGAAMRWARGYGEAGNGFVGLHRSRGCVPFGRGGRGARYPSF